MRFIRELLRRSVKRWARNANFQYRLATSRFRSLPHFLVIGAHKSGTTSLFYYMIQHPQIAKSLRKMIDFFDGGLNPSVDAYANTPLWYRAHFPFTRSLGNRSVTGEASPTYMFSPLAPGRIFSLIPSVKLIAILRNPTERAISHYFHERRGHREPLPIMEALQEEEKRTEVAWRSNDFKTHEVIYCSYKRRGLYKEQLDRYFQYFSADQFLILSSEDFSHEPANTISKVFDFLGVDPDFKVPDLKPRNVGMNKTAVPREVYDYLDDYFVQHNHELYQLIGKQFDWQKASA